MNEECVDWKYVLLSRWASEFPPASEMDSAVLRSSQEIADDLKDAGDFSPGEVSAFLAVNGYKVVFDGGYPKWLISGAENSKAISEF